jgi:hypothetical protein
MDLDSLGGLVAPRIGPQVRPYRYPEEETKLREGDEVKARDDRSEADLPTLSPIPKSDMLPAPT